METIGTIRVSKPDSLDFNQKLAKGIGEIHGDEGVRRGVFVVFRGGIRRWPMSSSRPGLSSKTDMGR